MSDITIAGRAHKTLHVVADKWDEGGESVVHPIHEGKADR